MKPWMNDAKSHKFPMWWWCCGIRIEKWFRVNVNNMQPKQESARKSHMNTEAVISSWGLLECHIKSHKSGRWLSSKLAPAGSFRKFWFTAETLHLMWMGCGFHACKGEVSPFAGANRSAAVNFSRAAENEPSGSVCASTFHQPNVPHFHQRPFHAKEFSPYLFRQITITVTITYNSEIYSFRSLLSYSAAFTLSASTRAAAFLLLGLIYDNFS